ncbi:helix-turn-helix domain-containing protein [Streptomyces sp. PT12]|uniref:helix-turn-helix domain-containing protein n=1 Tax=Streptomyces sp. PT12 TaxID=1510197 RepID=UPI000DE4772B|nr:helix-turn-helix transcriptional regulator [Streptomyces sp. PT12]RBM22409.1 XRE family transcriptional regulator [Streptomyces sp. PT12]
MPDNSGRGYDTSIGRRIQAIRNQRGLTQHGLAQRAHISYSTLTKVESGHKSASPTVTAACARALRVPVTDLTGQPYFDALKKDQLEELVQPLRHAVANPLLASPETAPRPLAELRADLDTLDESRRRGEYMAIGATVPAVVDELLHVIDNMPTGIEQQRVYGLLAQAYRLAQNFSHKLGFLDLALLSLDRMEQAASHAEDPYLPVVICHYRSNYFLHHGGYDVGLREVSAWMQRLEEPVRRGDLRATSAMGTMHLKAAVLHSRRRRPTSSTQVGAHINEARALARQVAGMPDPYGLIFDTHNVEVHVTSTGIDLGDPGTAAEHGASLQLPTGWAMNRAGHHYMDMARALERIGRRDDALKNLVKARAAAPAQTRYHPTTRETTLALLRGRSTPSQKLSEYAAWVGI